MFCDALERIMELDAELKPDLLAFLGDALYTDHAMKSRGLQSSRCVETFQLHQSQAVRVSWEFRQRGRPSDARIPAHGKLHDHNRRMAALFSHSRPHLGRTASSTPSVRNHICQRTHPRGSHSQRGKRDSIPQPRIYNPSEIRRATLVWAIQWTPPVCAGAVYLERDALAQPRRG